MTNSSICFNYLKGCDSSLLIDGPTSEKTADSNFSVRGYELIEKLKAAMEEACPDVVSCSDIVAIATKVVIKLVSTIYIYIYHFHSFLLHRFPFFFNCNVFLIRKVCPCD